MLDNQNNHAQENSIGLKDLFHYLLGYWYVFILCLLLFCGYALYKYSKTQFLFSSSSTIVIKDPGKAQMSVSLDAFNNRINRVNISNEMLQFKSKRLMAETVRRLDADINYQNKQVLRLVELYTDSPVKVMFPPAARMNMSADIRVIPADLQTVKVQMPSLGVADTVITLGDSIRTTAGYVRVIATRNYGESWIGRTILVNKVPVMAAAKAFISRLGVSQVSLEASQLRLSISDYSLQRSKDILNTLVTVYNDDAIAEKNQVVASTADFIAERLIIIQEELGDVEQQLASYKSSHKMMDASEEANLYLSDYRASNAAVTELETQIKLAEYLRDYIADPANADKLIPVNTGFDNTLIDGQVAQFNSTKVRRDKLLSDSSLENPVVKGLNTSLINMRQALISSVESVIGNLQTKKKEALRRENVSVQQFSSMPVRAREMLTIERQQEIKETLYTYLLNKREENALTELMVDNNARVVDEAEGSWIPIYPTKSKMLFVAVLTALFLPAFILIMKLFLDTKIHTRRDVESAVDIPILGDLPVVKRRTLKESVAKGRASVYDHDSKSGVTEAFRMLCTNLDFLREDDQKSMVVSLVSYNASAGKSFVASAMAACLADAQRSVLVIDLDLRKRTLSGNWGFKHKQQGLSHYLVNPEVRLSDILKKNVCGEGVDFIPAGIVPPNPVALLRKQRFDDLINELRGMYDFIILDSLPLNMVADSMVVNRVTDINLFVLRCGTLDRRLLHDLQGIYQSDKLHKLSIVMNGVDVRHGYGYYGYGYYGYGYGEE